MSFLDSIRAALGNKDHRHRDVAADNRFSEFDWLVYSDEDPAKKRRARHRKCLIVSAAVVAAGAVAFLAASIIGRGSVRIVKVLERGEDTRDVELHLELEYSGSTLEKDIDVSVLPRHISEQDAEQLFDECEAWIRAQLAEGVRFPAEAPNGVSIIWQEDELSFLGDADAEETVTAQLGAGEYFRIAEFAVVVPAGAEEHMKGLEALSEKLADDLSRNDEGDGLVLPSDAEGASLKWSFPNGISPALIIPVCIFLAAFVWMSRDDAEKRLLRKRRATFENEIPGMSFQVMLLLNAGLIAESAFAQLIEQTAEEQGPLYRIFRDIKQRALLRNVSFINELYAFAKESHCGSLLRFSSLVYEHASRGASLADKLEQERELMLGSRLSSARARVKEAETKLCLPLILLLIALIIITAAPSFMTM